MININNEEFDDNFGKFIEKRRLESGINSQRQFAKVLSISNSTVARIERGESEPSDATLIKIAEVLAIKYQDLQNIKDRLVTKNRFKNIDHNLITKIKKMDTEQKYYLDEIINQMLSDTE